MKNSISAKAIVPNSARNQEVFTFSNSASIPGTNSMSAEGPSSIMTSSESVTVPNSAGSRQVRPSLHFSSTPGIISMSETAAVPGSAMTNSGKSVAYSQTVMTPSDSTGTDSEESSGKRNTGMTSRYILNILVAPTS